MSTKDDKKMEVINEIETSNAEDLSRLEEDDEIINNLLLPDDKVEYPTGDRWSNLGRNIREQVSRESRPVWRLRPLTFFAAAASFILLLGVVVLQFSNQTSVNTSGQVAVPRNVQSVDELADTELADIEILMLQTELDLLSLELCGSNPTVDELDCFDIREIIQSDDVGTDFVIEDYMKLL